MRFMKKRSVALALAALLALPLLASCNDPYFEGGVYPPLTDGSLEQEVTPDSGSGDALPTAPTETPEPTVLPEPTPEPPEPTKTLEELMEDLLDDAAKDRFNALLNGLLTEDSKKQLEELLAGMPEGAEKEQMKVLLEELFSEENREHLFEQKAYLEELFTGFSKDNQYLIADFKAFLEQYSPEDFDETKFLFALEKGLDEETLEAIKKEVESKKPILEKLAEDEQGKKVVEYAIYTLNSDPTMKKIAVTFFDTNLGKQVVCVYRYITAPDGDLPIIPPDEVLPVDPQVEE